MIDNVEFKFEVSASSDPVKEKASIKLIKAHVINEDNVKDNSRNIIPIADKCKTPRGHKILYNRMQNNVIMLTRKYDGHTIMYKPYKVGMEVKGFINKDKQFVITKHEHKFQ